MSEQETRYTLNGLKVWETPQGNFVKVADLMSAKHRIAELESALDDLLACGERPCDLVHHGKKDEHPMGEPCPVLQRYRALMLRGKDGQGE